MTLPLDLAAPRNSQTGAKRAGIIRALVSNPLSVAALLWLAILIALVFVVSYVISISATDQNLADTLSGPTTAHLLGTDQLGRDLLARLMIGGRVSLAGVAIATVVALLVGCSAGLVAGYFRSRLDILLSSGADILQSIPSIIILLSVAAVFARNQSVLMVTLGLLMSASVFRIVRATTLDVRAELYITAARTSGLSDTAIIVTHILPRLGGVVVVQATIVASIATVIQVGLGYLGIDVVPPAPSWGNIVRDASGTIGLSVWQIIPPTVVVALSVLSFSTIGDVVQQAITGRGRGSGLGGTVPNSPALDQPLPPAAVPTGQAGIIRVRDFTVQAQLGGTAVTLVDRVSFHVASGEIVGLVGESGAGKSVTARALVGLFPKDARTEGSIIFDSTELLGAGEKALADIRGSEIAFVSQEPMVSLSPSVRIGSQLAEIVRTHRQVSRRESHRIAVELLETVEIPNATEVARKYPHEISGGMAQRVVIAVALSGNPRLIVADEPTTALDVSVQMQILELLRLLQRSRSLAVLLVTHDWGVVADLCDRAVVMYAGQVIESATVDQVFTRPRHPYTAALRAADPHSQTRGSRLVTIPGQVPAPGTWPVGCRFADRCQFAVDACRAGAVPLSAVAMNHAVRCIRAIELGGFAHG